MPRRLLDSARAACHALVAVAPLLLPASALCQQQPVVWRTTSGASQSGAALTKTAFAGWNAAASASQSLASGDGYLEFSLPAVGDAALGLSTRPGMTDGRFDFALRLGADRSMTVVQAGVATALKGSYRAGDRFRLAVEAGGVRFYRAGSLIYSSTKAPRYPLAPVAAIHTPGLTIQDAVLFGAPVENVEWSRTRNATGLGNSLFKSAGVDNAWDSSGSATRGIAAPDGYVEFDPPDGLGQVAIGLGHVEAARPEELEYGVSFDGDGAAVVLDHGARRAVAAYAPGDRFRIGVESSVVVYRKNGAVVATAIGPSEYPLLVCAALRTRGSAAPAAVLGGDVADVAAAAPRFLLPSGHYAGPQAVRLAVDESAAIRFTTSGADPTESDPTTLATSAMTVAQDVTIKARAHRDGIAASGVTAAVYTLGTTASEAVAWTRLVNAGSSQGRLTKVAGAEAVWNAGAASTRAITSADGYLEVVADQTGGELMFGLSAGDRDQSYQDIAFAIGLEDGAVRVYEAGQYRGSFGAFSAGDRFKVALENGSVRYRRNGQLLYASNVTPTLPLIADASLYRTGSAIRSATLSGRLADATFPAPAAADAFAAWLDEAGAFAYPLAAPAGGVAPLSASSSIPQTGLELWLQADVGITRDASNRVSTWGDQSGLANHANQATQSAQPIWVADSGGGVPAVRFDGVNDALTLTTRITTGRTVFLSLRNSDSGGYRAPLGDNTTAHTYTSDYDREIWKYTDPASVIGGETRLNGTPVDGTVMTYPSYSSPLAAVSSVATASVATTYIGRAKSTGYFWLGDISEVIVYDRVLTAAERQQVEEYLLRKYGSVPDLPPSAPSVSPNGGGFAGSVSVSLSTTTAGASIRYTTDGSEPSATNGTEYVGPVTLSATTTVRAKAFLGALASRTTVAGFTKSTDFSPASVSGLQVWLRGDAGVDSTDGWVSAWRDQSGHGNDATQPTSAAIPPLVTDSPSGLPALHFNGLTSWLALNSALTTGRTVFMVVRLADGEPQELTPLGNATGPTYNSGWARQIWDWSNDPAVVTNGETWLNGLPVNSTAGAVYPPATAPLAVVTSVATGSVTTSFVGRGATNSTYWDGDIAEIVLYDRALTGPERHQVEEYLMRKYASVANLPSSPAIATPNGGVFSGTVQVSLATATPGATIRYTTDGSEPSPTNGSTYAAPIELAASATVRAKAYLGALASATTVVGFTRSTDFNPTSLSGLQLWLRSDAGVDPAGGYVTTWRDQSGLGNDATRTSGRTPPASVTDADGVPVVRFGGHDSLTLTTRITTGRTVILALRHSAPPLSYAAPLGDQTGQTYRSGYAREIWADADTSSVLGGGTFLNGTQVLDGRTSTYPLGTAPLALLSSVATASVSTQYVGSEAGTWNLWLGDIAEVVIYDRALTTQERQQVEQYLRARYSRARPGIQHKQSSSGYSSSWIKPVVTTPGDVMLVHTVGYPPVTGPAGWTRLAEVQVGGGYYGWWYKSASAADDTIASYTFGNAVATVGSVYSGVDPSQPVGAFQLTPFTGSSLTTFTHPGISLAAANSTVMAAITKDASSGEDTFVDPAGFTKEQELEGSFSESTRAYSSAGDIGPQSWTWSVPASSGVALLLELRAPSSNQAPLVNAGPDQTVTFPAQVSLSGSATDDGLPSNTLSYTWSQVSGPGTVTFGAPNAATTTATFSVGGVYVLRLTVSDGVAAGTDDVQITALDQVAAPTITPASGTYTTTQTVTIAATAGATIRYTLDGSDPTAGSTVYGAPIQVSADMTVKALAFLAGWADSNVTSADYVITGTLQTPTITPPGGTYDPPVSVTMTGPSGAELRYTTDGSAPTAMSTLYTGAFGVTTPTTVTAAAFKTGWTPSPSALEAYQVRTAIPVITPASSTYTTPQTVTITAAGGVTIRYTLDGSEPTASSAPYVGALTISTGTTVRAVAFQAGWAPSAVAQATYEFSFGTVAAPTISPTSGTYEGSVEVEITGGPGATTYYTLDGSIPTPASTVYAGPFVLSAPAVVRAASFRLDWTPSPVSQQTYALAVASPVFVPPGGAYTGPLDVAITTATPGGTVTYTTDGSEPLESGVVLAAGATVHVESPTRLRARAWKSGLTPSASVEAWYSFGRGSVAAGYENSFVVTAQGDLWAWGGASSARSSLGLPAEADHLVPEAVPGMGNVKSVSAGYGHTIVLKTDGTVWTAGANWAGQLGGGSGADRATFQQVQGLTSVQQVAAGGDHAVALMSDGTVLAWGDNSHGQLGDGTTATPSTPIQVPALAGVVSVAAGSGYSLALTSDGHVYSWGSNWGGALGTGIDPYGMSPVPALVPGLAGIAWIASGPTAAHSFAVTTGGVVYGWGLNAQGALGIGTTEDRLTPVVVPAMAGATGLALGQGHTLALLSDQSLWSCGANDLGGLGVGDNNDRLTPERIAGLSGIVSVAAGSWHSLALTGDGRVYTWGGAWAGQLGNGQISTPTPSPSVRSDVNFLFRTVAPTFSPAAGTYNNPVSVAISSPTPGAVVHYTTDGSEPSAGSQQLAQGASVPVQTSATVAAVAVAPGYAPSEVVRAAYVLETGDPTATPPAGSYAGRVTVGLASPTNGVAIRYTVDGTEPNASSAVYTGPITLTSSTTIRARAFSSNEGWADSSTWTGAYEITPATGALAAGQAFSVALEPSGAIWTWGANGTGQLGDGTTSDSPEPIQVMAVGDAVSVSAGGGHVLALRADGSVVGWGDNQFGQVGTGAGGPSQTTPIQIPEVSNAVAIAAGGGHSLALRRDGRVLAWGVNDAGQLGTSDGTGTATPLVVEPLYDVVSVAAGAQHSLALGSDGRAWAWGGAWGSTPQVALDAVVSVAAGGSQSIAIRTDGSVWLLAHGEAPRPLPGCSGGPVLARAFGSALEAGASAAESGELSPMRAVAAGDTHGLAISSDGQLRSWGTDNAYGQLGRGGSVGSACLVDGIADVVVAAGGTTHSLALTADGAIWSWGDNTSGQLGDGTVDPHWVAVQVVPGAFQWRIPTPRITPSGGHHPSPVMVAIAVPMAGAEIRYTTDGSIPAAESPLYTGPFQVSASKTIMAVAFKAGRQSAVGQASFTFNYGKLETPTILPGSRIVTEGPLVVTITAPAGSTVWYQLAAEGPWQEYSTPLVLDTHAAVSAYAERDDWTTSETATENFTFRVARPALAPDSGTYAPGGALTVVCPTTGSTVHYTTDGSVPTEASQALACNGTLPLGRFRLGLRAFRDGYEPSALKWAEYYVSTDADADPDRDGLTNGQEQALGTDPNSPDTNADGLLDGAAVALGISATNLDMDGDGLSNAEEHRLGTGPFDPDSDDDGVSDGLDCLPLDPGESACPAGSDDGVPPTIVLTAPSGARLVSTNP